MGVQSGSSRWLMIVGVGLVALVAVSVVVALVGRSGTVLLPEDTPEGTVQRYLQAIEAGEIREAYAYLGAGLDEECDYQRFRDTTRRFESQEQRITLGDSEELDGGEVEVSVRVTTFSVDPPFGTREYSYGQSFTLIQEEGLWRFSEGPWPMGQCFVRVESAPIRRPPPTPAPVD